MHIKYPPSATVLWSHLICLSITDGLVATVSAKMWWRMFTPGEKCQYHRRFLAVNPSQTLDSRKSASKVLIVSRLGPYEAGEPARPPVTLWTPTSRYSPRGAHLFNSAYIRA